MICAGSTYSPLEPKHAHGLYLHCQIPQDLVLGWPQCPWWRGASESRPCAGTTCVLTLPLEPIYTHPTPLCSDSLCYFWDIITICVSGWGVILSKTSENKDCACSTGWTICAGDHRLHAWGCRVKETEGRRSWTWGSPIHVSLWSGSGGGISLSSTQGTCLFWRRATGGSKAKPVWKHVLTFPPWPPHTDQGTTHPLV